MSGNGAYEGEMNDVALFETALRSAVVTRPDPQLGATLVPRLAEVARASALEAETRPAPRGTAAPRSRFALVARVGIAVALIPLVLAGLAFAGVTVPAPARDAFDSLGITLPNQPAKSAISRVRQGPAPSQAHGGGNSQTTTTKGKSDAAHQHALEQHNKAKGKAKGHEQGKAIGLNGSTPPGQAKPKETGPPSHSNSGGNSAKHTSTTSTAPAPTTPTAPASGGNGKGASNGHATGHTKSRHK